jgi:hypothetical protein
MGMGVNSKEKDAEPFELQFKLIIMKCIDYTYFIFSHQDFQASEG